MAEKPLVPSKRPPKRNPALHFQSGASQKQSYTWTQSVNSGVYIPSMNIHEHSKHVIGQLLLAE